MIGYSIVHVPSLVLGTHRVLPDPDFSAAFTVVLHLLYAHQSNRQLQVAHVSRVECLLQGQWERVIDGYLIIGKDADTTSICNLLNKSFFAGKRSHHRLDAPIRSIARRLISCRGRWR